MSRLPARNSRQLLKQSVPFLPTRSTLAPVGVTSWSLESSWRQTAVRRPFLKGQRTRFNLGGRAASVKFRSLRGDDNVAFLLVRSGRVDRSMDFSPSGAQR